MIQVKRVYLPKDQRDGKRVLVDRLWPRGLSKERAGADVWLKDAGPSTALRKWFGHDPARWTEFQARYRKELQARREVVEELRRYARRGNVTLLFGARDEVHNEAVVLAAMLKRGGGNGRRRISKRAAGRGGEASDGRSDAKK